MLKNYFITALHNLTRHKLYSVINIVGLAIGLAACILIGLYVVDELSYDKQWRDSDRIYRLNFTFSIPGSDPVTIGSGPIPAMPAVAQYFPEKIEFGAREVGVQRIVKIGSREFDEYMGSVDPDLLNIFQFELLSGSFENTFSSISNVALSEEAATRFFGEDNPIGKTITVDTQGQVRDYQVSAVYRIPGNTVLDLPMFALLDDSSLPASFLSWFSANARAFFKLKPGVDIQDLIPYGADIIDQNSDISQVFPDPDLSPSDLIQMSFQNVETLHLESPFDTTRAGGNKTVVYSFAAISLLVLLIGCINFTVLTTAKSTQRAREVAMRKVVGAKRKQLIRQLLGESYFIVGLAMFLALGLVELGLPLFEAMVGKPLALDYSLPATWLSMLGLLLIVGLCGGLYPAFILSGFRPSGVLKANQSAETRGSILLRYMLVVFQFSIAIVLIISTGVIYAQLRYSLNRDPGFNKENLLVINRLETRPELVERIKPFKQKLLTLPGVSDVAISNFQPSQQRQAFFVYTLLGERAGTSFTIGWGRVGYDYFSTYQIPFVAGRNFDPARDRPDPEWDPATGQIGNSGRELPLVERNIILNVSAVREMGFADPDAAIGKVINTTTLGNTNYTIIGVVADNHLFSINAPPKAETYLLAPYDQPSVVTVRFTGSPQAVLEQVRSAWREVMGDVEIYTAFVDQLLAEEYRQEQLEMRVILSFSLLAIVIACLGLYGSAAFTVDRRVREIGLRKVMGARVKQIVILLIRQFTKPVLIANVIAWPVAIYAMLRWLERFPYQLDHWYFAPLCVGAGLTALVIAWLTVAGNAVKVARANPIIALRYE